MPDQPPRERARSVFDDLGSLLQAGADAANQAKKWLEEHPDPAAEAEKIIIDGAEGALAQIEARAGEYRKLIGVAKELMAEPPPQKRPPPPPPPPPSA